MKKKEEEEERKKKGDGKREGENKVTKLISDIIATKAKNKRGNDKGKLGKREIVTKVTVWMSGQGGDL